LGLNALQHTAEPGASAMLVLLLLLLLLTL